MHARVREQYEVVPFLLGTFPVDELEFRPLPPDMRSIIEASPDFVEPEPGRPTMLLLESEELSGGLVVLTTPGDGAMLLLAPRA